MEAEQRAPALVRNAVRKLFHRHAPVLFRHVSSFHLSEDRKLLEAVILPYFASDSSVERVLFVGCEWYTKPYKRLFRSKEYWTLEIDPEKRRYGARRHVVDALKHLRQHAAAGYFDAVICNGVFMKTAIETREEAEPSFEACRECLRAGGWLVLGWNDTDELRPYPPTESAALAKFEQSVFPPLGVSEYATQTSYRHTYTFYRKS